MQRRKKGFMPFRHNNMVILAWHVLTEVLLLGKIHQVSGFCIAVFQRRSRGLWKAGSVISAL